MTHSDSNMLQYFTVVGVGRSGTSLLMTALDSHPQLAMPPETQFVWRHVVKYPGATVQETRARLACETNFARLETGVDELLEPFLSGRQPFSNAAVYRRIMELWAKRTGVRRIGDKSPKNIEYLPVIHRLFPDARVIHIIRDPRDVYLSRTKAKWCAGRPRVLQTLAYRAQFDLARRLGPKLFGANYLEVHYEDLVFNPAKELSRICRLLGVPFDVRMLDRGNSARTHVFAEELDWKQEVLGPLLTANYDKWHSELSPADVAYIEDSCHTAFRDGRYAPARLGKLGYGGIRGVWLRAQMNILRAAYTAWLGHRNRTAIRRIGTSAPVERARSAA